MATNPRQRQASKRQNSVIQRLLDADPFDPLDLIDALADAVARLLALQETSGRWGGAGGTGGNSTDSSGRVAVVDLPTGRTHFKFRIVK